MSDLTEAEQVALRSIKAHGNVRAFFASVAGTQRPMPAWQKPEGVMTKVPPRNILENLTHKGYLDKVPTIVEWNGSWFLYKLTGKGKNT